MLDILIKDGLVADGTGGKAYRADVAVRNGKIVRIAPGIDAEAKTVIDAAGKVVSPGFIDNHSHGDYFCLFGTDGYNLLEQGITTEIAGNCGGGALPYYEGLLDGVKGMVPYELIEQVKTMTTSFRAFSEAASGVRMGTNMAVYAPHGNIRACVMGFGAAKPTPEQMEQMKALVAEAMESGLVGLSTGLIYPPSVYADQQELTELCRVVAKYNGCYSSHVRGECDTVVNAVAEAIAIG
jgi:N-acyl-D-amino-acid deacylase